MSLFLADSITLRLDERDPRSPSITGEVSCSLYSDVTHPARLTLELVVTETYKLRHKRIVTHKRTSSLPRQDATLREYPEGLKHGIYPVRFTLAIPEDYPRSAGIKEHKLNVQVSKKLIAKLMVGPREILQHELEIQDAPLSCQSLTEHKKEFKTPLIRKPQVRCCCIVEESPPSDDHIFISSSHTGVRPGDQLIVSVGANTESVTSGTVRFVRIVDMKDPTGHTFTDVRVIYWLHVALSKDESDGLQRTSVAVYIPQNVEYMQTQGVRATIKYAVEFTIQANEYKACSVRAPCIITNR